MDNKFKLIDLVSWIFGIMVFLIGLINTFWGNDSVFGIFIMLASFVYYKPITDLVKKITGINIHWSLKVLLGLLILWAALGVGELFDKMQMMRMDLFAS